MNSVTSPVLESVESMGTALFQAIESMFCFVVALLFPQCLKATIWKYFQPGLFLMISTGPDF